MDSRDFPCFFPGGDSPKGLQDHGQASKCRHDKDSRACVSAVEETRCVTTNLLPRVPTHYLPASNAVVRAPFGPVRGEWNGTEFPGFFPGEEAR
jgi:hypothetical protein